MSNLINANQDFRFSLLDKKTLSPKGADKKIDGLLACMNTLHNDSRGLKKKPPLGLLCLIHNHFKKSLS